MKRRQGLLPFLGLLALLGGAEDLLSQSSTKEKPQEPLVLKLGTLAPKSSIWGNYLREFRKTLYVKTRDSAQPIKLQMYYGGVQGDEIEMAKKIRYGQLDGGFLTGNGLGEAASEMRLLDLPFLFDNYKEADFVYERIRSDLNDITMKKGFFLAAIGSVGYVYFFSKRPIQSIEDIRRTRAWIWKGDALVHEAMKAMDIPGTAVNLTEVSTALQTGLISTVYSTPTALIALQWHKEMETMLNMRLTLASSGLILSTSSWVKVSERNQELFQKALDRVFRRLLRDLRRSDDEAMNLLTSQYLTLNEPTESVVQLRRHGEALRQRLRRNKTLPEALLERTEQLLQEHRSKAPLPKKTPSLE